MNIIKIYTKSLYDHMYKEGDDEVLKLTIKIDNDTLITEHAIDTIAEEIATRLRDFYIREYMTTAKIKKFKDTSINGDYHHLFSYSVEISVSDWFNEAFKVGSDRSSNITQSIFWYDVRDSIIDALLEYNQDISKYLSDYTDEVIEKTEEYNALISEYESDRYVYERQLIKSKKTSIKKVDKIIKMRLDPQYYIKNKQFLNQREDVEEWEYIKSSLISDIEDLEKRINKLKGNK